MNDTSSQHPRKNLYYKNMFPKKYQSIVVLTGAGISAESGIRTFRASDGLWEDHKIEDVASQKDLHEILRLCTASIINDVISF